MRKLWHRLFGHWHWSIRLTRTDVEVRAFHVNLDAPPIAHGLVSVNGVLYTMTPDGSKVILRQSADGGSTWTASTTPSYRWDPQDNG